MNLTANIPDADWKGAEAGRAPAFFPFVLGQVRKEHKEIVGPLRETVDRHEETIRQLRGKIRERDEAINRLRGRDGEDGAKAKFDPDNRRCNGRSPDGKKGKKGKRHDNNGGTREGHPGPKPQKRPPYKNNDARIATGERTADAKMRRECGNKLSDHAGRETRTTGDAAGFGRRAAKRIPVRRHCRHHKKRRTAVPDGVPSHKRFGANIMAIAATMHVMGISFGKTGDPAETMYGRRMAKSTLMDMCYTASDKCRSAYGDPLERLKHAAVVAGDETGWFLGKMRRRVWVFAANDSVVYIAADTRGRAVVNRVPDGGLGIVPSDSFAAWYGAGSVRQKRPAHRFRNMFAPPAGNAGAEFVAFAGSPESAPERSLDLHGEYGRVVPGRYVRNPPGDMDGPARGKHADGDCIGFAKRLRRERDSLFTFPQFPADCRNNPSERALRAIATMRKILYGNRSERGERTTETPSAVYAACRLRGTTPHEFILGVLNGGTATLPLPETTEAAAKTAVH